MSRNKSNIPEIAKVQDAIADFATNNKDGIKYLVLFIASSPKDPDKKQSLTVALNGSIVDLSIDTAIALFDDDKKDIRTILRTALDMQKQLPPEIFDKITG